MKITDNRKKNIIRFGGLVTGEVFIFENKIYMKIPKVDCDSRIYNNVNLISGSLGNLASSCEVESIKCELVLKN